MNQTTVLNAIPVLHLIDPRKRSFKRKTVRCLGCGHTINPDALPDGQITTTQQAIYDKARLYGYIPCGEHWGL